ncbi:hypothetical protein GCM10022246_31230 [Pedobacter ginsengiterrae]|uniref:Peptidase S74 domain-containing protein n=1 Tax=Pedobacter ginsengiterrae TaxID=871696 RepID=A0ABP7Q6B5_9SPHI
MRNIFTTVFLFITYFAYAQTGIGTITPRATLDIISKPADLSVVDGIIAPRLTGNELKNKDNIYGNNQNGTLVFATSPASPSTPKTIEVVKSGYYYYDATAEKWLAFKSSADNQTITNVISNPINTITSTVNGITSTTSAVNSVSNSVSNTNFLTTTVNGINSTPVAVKNIYNSDGTLTGNRTITMEGNGLRFGSATGDTNFDGNYIYQTSKSTSVTHQLEAGTAPNNGTLSMSIVSGTQATIQAGNGANVLVIRTQSTNLPAPITFNTSNGGGATAQGRAEISGDGRFNVVQSLSVGYNSQQTFTGSQKLKVNGSIVTTSNTYPDYVFEKYFTGNSSINPKYDFKKLEEVKSFIQKNHHLPGIISIKDLQKSEGGYAIDLTKLSIQQLEKIEELYLHVIELESLTKKQQNQIQKLAIRLENIEKNF